MSKLIVNIPFPGFYESDYSRAIDCVEEREAEYMSERECSFEYYPEEFQPEHLRIEASEYCELFMDCTDYSACYMTIAHWYVNAFSLWMSDNLGLPRKAFTFEAMKSPREYNFGTDRLFAYVSKTTMRKLFRKSKAGGHELLASLIKERFTSYDGFSSFYSNDISDWLEKPLEDWDHNELGTLLGAMIQTGEDYQDADAWHDSLYEMTLGDSGDDQARETGVDWKKLETKIADLREEKLEAYYEENPDMKPENMPVPPYRCPFTAELPF